MFTRYAFYFVPDGVWGDAGAAWLGWDNRTGTEIALATDDQTRLTDRPRKYGFHATIKAPFRLAGGRSETNLIEALDTLATDHTAISLNSLKIAQIGRFYAFTAPDEQAALVHLSSAAVRDLDPFRAPLTEGDLARRRASKLSTEEDAALVRWGYPYVMKLFRFHLTLTGPVRSEPSPLSHLQSWFSDALRNPLAVDSLSLVGEREDGRFVQIHRAHLQR